MRTYWCEPTGTAVYTLEDGDTILVDDTPENEPEDWDSKEPLWRRTDTGAISGLRDMEPGAMWDAHWMHGATKTPDGRYLVVRLPNGSDWAIDSRASNCTKPDDDEHDCWCRHGDPPNVTVDKQPAPGRSTCEAGGGSIWVGQGTDSEWHGFLRSGELVKC